MTRPQCRPRRSLLRQLVLWRLCLQRQRRPHRQQPLYVSGESDELPTAAMLASLGCGNPTALAELKAGETVLDLGSGCGIDVLHSARRVGPTGKAYGLDMTDDMLLLARQNAAESGVTNVEFLKGQIEQIPLPDASVDVIISNCVINLSGDKHAVLAEAFRVLKPGGCFAVSDVVVRGEVPAAVRRSMEPWVGCVVGALEETQFKTLLTSVGFENADVEPTRVYKSEDARAFLTEAGIDVDAHIGEIGGRFMVAFVRASKPLAKRYAHLHSPVLGVRRRTTQVVFPAALKASIWYCNASTQLSVHSLQSQRRMRYALISDIHANLHALDAVLDDIDHAHFDATYHIGDLVGYGALPDETIARLRTHAFAHAPSHARLRTHAFAHTPSHTGHSRCSRQL